jgi:spore maturation protein CgeB
MNILIVSPEQVRQDERYMDDKGWAFDSAFQRLGLRTRTFFYRKMGRLVLLERNKYLRYLWLSYMNSSLLDQVRRIKPDMLFLSRAETVRPETLWKIRKDTQTLIVNVFTDNPLSIGKFEAIEPCHYFFVKDTYVRDTLRKAGLRNVLYLPQCTNEDVYRPYELTETERGMLCADVSLVGSRYSYRVRLLKELEEFNIALWGRGWSKVSDKRLLQSLRGGDIRGPKKARVFSGSAISLNPHHPLNDIRGTNSRTFDIAACKGFQLSDDKEDLRDLLKAGEEIICFRTTEELRKLIGYYLSHPDERKQLAEAAYQRVLKDHTYYNRACEILDIIKNSPPA